MSVCAILGEMVLCVVIIFGAMFVSLFLVLLEYIMRLLSMYVDEFVWLVSCFVIILLV